MVNKRIQFIIIQWISDMQFFDIFVRQDIWLSVEYVAIRHVSTRHSPAKSAGHVRVCPVNSETIMKRTTPRLHWRGDWHRIFQLRIDVKYAVHISANSYFVKTCLFM